MADVDDTAAPLAITATLDAEPVQLLTTLDEELALTTLLEEVSPMDLTLEEAEELDVVIGEQQGLRGPRGPEGPPGPQGGRGEPGPPGASGGATATLTKLSRGPLSAGRVVRLEGSGYCTPVSALERGDAFAPVALVVHAVSEAELKVSVLAYGEHEDDTWHWTPDAALFLGADGFLTEVRGEGWAFVRVVAVAITPTRVFVDPQRSVMLVGG